ncbi:MAG TPA: hypothetical protein VN256_22675 [Pyrinomonadaceae bacterium]|nr:hypothetical protein [Pyrinomonadaceae bacterium]
MKKLIRFLVFAALVATLALPALAQNTTTTQPAAAATQDDQEAKTNLYNKFRDNLKTNPQVAYEAGKEYLTKYEATDGPSDTYVAYIKKWVDSYEKIARRNQVIQQLNAKDYNNAFTGAKQVLVDYPDDLALLFELSKAGLAAASSGNAANNAAAIDYARRTLQMIEAGKTFEKDKPIPNKDEIVGALNYELGFLLRESDPTTAANYFITAAQKPGFSQKDPRTYSFLAVAYEQSEYAKLRNDYEANCKTEEQLKGPQCTELTAKVNNVVDRMIDALARAIAYSKTSPEAAQFEQARTAWMEQLTALYKYRNNGDAAGLDALIAGVTAKPLPRPGQATTPTTTPASNTTPPTQPGSTGSTTTTQPANGGTTSSTQPKPNR